MGAWKVGDRVGFQNGRFPNTIRVKLLELNPIVRRRIATIAKKGVRMFVVKSIRSPSNLTLKGKEGMAFAIVMRYTLKPYIPASTPNLLDCHLPGRIDNY
jgi:hypothetical protein